MKSERLVLRPLLADPIDPAAEEQYAHHGERRAAVRTDEGEVARQPAHDEDQPNDDAAHGDPRKKDRPR